MGVFGTNPVIEATADGYLRGQVWNRPQKKKYPQYLLIKTVTDITQVDNVNGLEATIRGFGAIARKILATGWDKTASPLSPTDPDEAGAAYYGVASTTSGGLKREGFGYNLEALSAAGYRYLCLGFRRTVSRISDTPQPTPPAVASYTPTWPTFSMSTIRHTSAGNPPLANYLGDSNIYPDNADRKIASISSMANKNFANYLTTLPGYNFQTGKAVVYFAVQYDIQTGTASLIPHSYPGYLVQPPTIPPQGFLDMLQWDSYIEPDGAAPAAGTAPYSVTLGPDPTLTPF